MSSREMVASQRYKTNSQVWNAVGMWAWMLHRITGIGLVMYLLLHATLISTSLISGAQSFNSTLTMLMTNTVLHYMELLLVGAVIYHGLNGIRLLLFDIGVGFSRQKEIFWSAMVLGVMMWVYVVIVKLS